MGLLVLRVSIGLIFFLHGWMKLFGHQVSFLREMLHMAGVTLPDPLIWLATAIELGAGLALMAGLFTRPAALLLTAEMVIAVLLFDLQEGFFIVSVPNVPLAYGFEYHLALIAGLVCVALGGPGRWALASRGASAPAATGAAAAAAGDG